MVGKFLVNSSTSCAYHSSNLVITAHWSVNTLRLSNARQMTDDARRCGVLRVLERKLGPASVITTHLSHCSPTYLCHVSPKTSAELIICLTNVSLFVVDRNLLRREPKDTVGNTT
jgi:hypothetical protein